MHPNRATSILFSNFLLIPTELTDSIKADGHQTLNVNVHRKDVRQDGATHSRSIEIPIGKMSANIALPPQAFFELGYQAGDAVQYKYNGNEVGVSSFSADFLDCIDDCEIDEDGIRIPPAALIQAFTGGPDTIDHIENGKRSADYYVALYNEHCGDFGDVGSVLDFGCGCGRVLSRMPASDAIQYYGIDLREDALQWLRNTMPGGNFSAGTAMPPCDIPAESLGLIYSVSVLTHLSQEQEWAWLDEWQRLLKVGGHLIVTFRAEDWVDQFTIERQKQAIKQVWSQGDGFCYQKHRYWEGIFPDYYAGTYQTLDYVRSVWGERFEILAILPPADTPNQQNTVVMKKLAAAR